LPSASHPFVIAAAGPAREAGSSLDRNEDSLG
jgi:hypothetical protein